MTQSHISSSKNLCSVWRRRADFFPGWPLRSGPGANATLAFVTGSSMGSITRHRPLNSLGASTITPRPSRSQ